MHHMGGMDILEMGVPADEPGNRDETAVSRLLQAGVGLFSCRFRAAQVAGHGCKKAYTGLL